jgi:hypothetical protein
MPRTCHTLHKMSQAGNTPGETSHESEGEEEEEEEEERK